MRLPRAISTAIGLAILAVGGAGQAAEPAPRPNVLVILSDDQGWGDLSVHGNTNLSTPRIDSLARDGALFDRFFVCPVCSPTRAEWLTGRYHLRGGVVNVTSGGERLDLDERTVADVFRAAGYATGAFGKWHNGSQYPYHPLGRGFDTYYGFTSGHWGDYFSPPLDDNGRPTRGEGFLPDDLTDHAIRFIETQRERPFLCYVPYNTPHSPMQVPDKFYDAVASRELRLRGGANEDLAFTRAALAMCENLDWNVGRLLDKLAALGIADNTIVVYFCDNGPNSPRWNGGMRGIKGSTDEGGVRSPLLIRWPRGIPAGTRVESIAGAIDLLPTLAELAGISPDGATPRDDAHRLDGRSLAGRLRGGAEAPSQADDMGRLLFSHWNGKVSVRTPRYRLDHEGRLYDMREDPEQRRDVASERPQVAERLREAVAAWHREVRPTPAELDRPFLVGHRQLPLTMLPARDGVPHGGVERSARAPNCSYFKHWSSPDDRITWDVEVATAGRYEVTLEYACPAADVGAEVELSLLGRTLTAKLGEPHDPPLVGAEHDRVPRKGESLVKDFRPWTMGVLELPAGRGELSLRGVKIPGSQVLELRTVRLTLVE